MYGSVAYPPDGKVMVKLVLLISLVEGAAASDTLTRPCVVAELGTVHA